MHTNSLHDQKKWNQTKLQFSPARSGCQKQEIEALECMRENESPSKQDRTEVSVYNNQEPRVALKMKKRSKRSSSSSIAMFASRACRSSIMIGDSLTRSKMETILRTMQNLDHPWECAHGRPTIRHVRDLLEDLSKDLDL